MRCDYSLVDEVNGIKCNDCVYALGGDNDTNGYIDCNSKVCGSNCGVSNSPLFINKHSGVFENTPERISYARIGRRMNLKGDCRFFQKKDINKKKWFHYIPLNYMLCLLGFMKRIEKR